MFVALLRFCASGPLATQESRAKSHDLRDGALMALTSLIVNFADWVAMTSRRWSTYDSSISHRSCGGSYLTTPPTVLYWKPHSTAISARLREQFLYIQRYKRSRLWKIKPTLSAMEHKNTGGESNLSSKCVKETPPYSRGVPSHQNHIGLIH